MVEKSLEERIEEWSKIPDASENIDIASYSLLDKVNYYDYKKDVDNIIKKGRKMTITYKCKNCGKMISRDFEDKPAFSITCDCGGKAVRFYGEIGIDKPVESASGAARMMIFSKDKSKTVV